MRWRAWGKSNRSRPASTSSPIVSKLDGSRKYERGWKHELVSKNQNVAKKTPTVAFPVIRMGYGFLNTIEGCTLSNGPRDIYLAVWHEFMRLPECTRHSMSFSPNDGEWVERAQWWKCFLYGVLPPKQAMIAMQRLLRWYRHCVLMRIGKENKL